MRPTPTALFLTSLATLGLLSAHAGAAEVDARPPDKLLLIANGSKLTDDNGGGASLNWLHYFTPDAIFGLGAEHQFIADSSWTFGSMRGSYSVGQPAKRFSIFGEAHLGNGDEDGRDWDYSVYVLGINQSLTSKLSVQLEGREIDIDTSYGNLPKIGLSYLATPRLLLAVSYAKSVSGNLGTELTTARFDYYGRVGSLLMGGATGRADPSVINLEPGSSLPAQDLKQGFIGVGKAFTRGEIQLLGDYLELGGNEKVTLTLSFTAYLGSRGRTQ
jgi:hypothetical protein